MCIYSGLVNLKKKINQAVTNPTDTLIYKHVIKVSKVQ